MSLIQKRPNNTAISMLYSFGKKSRTVMIVGLGNVGKKYDGTRHNIGFMTINHIAESQGVKWKKESRWNAEVASCTINGAKCILVKPQTFMNLSGEAITNVKAFYKLENSDIITLYDEIDIDYGIIRTRSGGGSAGHNGIKSIIQHIGEDFNRVRIGVGPKVPEQIETSDFVLGKFTKDQATTFNALYTHVAEIVNEYVNTDGAIQADSRNFLI
jgi:peptidyl-tRNA hydrolase, PTH1 family